MYPSHLCLMRFVPAPHNWGPRVCQPPTSLSAHVCGPDFVQHVEISVAKTKISTYRNSSETIPETGAYYWNGLICESVFQITRDTRLYPIKDSSPSLKFNCMASYRPNCVNEISFT